MWSLVFSLSPHNFQNFLVVDLFFRPHAVRRIRRFLENMGPCVLHVIADCSS